MMISGAVHSARGVRRQLASTSLPPNRYTPSPMVKEQVSMLPFHHLVCDRLSQCPSGFDAMDRKSLADVLAALGGGARSWRGNSCKPSVI